MMTIILFLRIIIIISDEVEKLLRVKQISLILLIVVGWNPDVVIRFFFSIYLILPAAL
jgi:hypothetical protein